VTAVLIIPALNEARALRKVLEEIPAGVFGEIIVVDNGSTDDTATVARNAGARVVAEQRRGYGSACLAGISALPREADVVVFMDADGSDLPSDADALMEPIVQDEADLVIGSRELGAAESGSLSPHQRLGNRLAVRLVSLLYGHKYTDLGPFRAIRRSALERLGMRDTNFGWTIEMQVKAVQRGLRIAEAPVSYRKRQAGQSKISGSLLGSAAAGAKILWTVAKHAIRNEST
jgi:glycosyltransferase involved in cell wall biosynthesis